jgi:hypothetical protein
MKKILAAVIVLAGPALVLAGLWMLNRGLVLLAAGGCVWWITQRGVAAARANSAICSKRTDDAVDRTLAGIERASDFNRNSC